MRTLTAGNYTAIVQLAVTIPPASRWWKFTDLTNKKNEMELFITS